MQEGPLKTQEITAGPVFGDISDVVSREHREGHLALQEMVVAGNFCHVFYCLRLSCLFMYRGFNLDFLSPGRVLFVNPFEKIDKKTGTGFSGQDANRGRIFGTGCKPG